VVKNLGGGSDTYNQCKADLGVAIDEDDEAVFDMALLIVASKWQIIES
jgi:hypothetical protein